MNKFYVNLILILINIFYYINLIFDIMYSGVDPKNGALHLFRLKIEQIGNRLFGKICFFFKFKLEIRISEIFIYISGLGLKFFGKN